MYQDIGEEAIAKQVYDRFPDLSSYINMHGLRKLARRALSRGYEEDLIIYVWIQLSRKITNARNITGMTR